MWQTGGHTSMNLQMNKQILIILLMIVFSKLLLAENKTFDRDSLVINKKTNLYQENLEHKKAQLNSPKLLKMKRSEALALGVIVTSAWGAYLSKERANYYFDKYEHSGPARLEHYMDKTKRFDRLSEGLLIVSYISTGYIIKRLLFN